MTSARVFFTAAVAVVVVQLMLPPVIGVANNGDFSRTYGIFHLTMPVADEVRFADTRYRFDPQVNYFGGFYSSETLLVPAALGLNAILSKDGAFDVRSMGLVHGAMFLAAFYLLLTLLSEAPWGLRWLVGGLALAAFGDVMYVAYLNSFYTDVAAYLFLLLSVVLALRVLRWRRRADMMLLGVASLLLVTFQGAAFGPGFLAGRVLLCAGLPSAPQERPMVRACAGRYGGALALEEHARRVRGAWLLLDDFFACAPALQGCGPNARRSRPGPNLPAIYWHGVVLRRVTHGRSAFRGGI